MTAATLRPVFYAGRRAAEVWWTGLLMLIFWLVLITVGPYLESRLWPVIDDFHIAEVDTSDPSIVKFRPGFDKTRPCTYLGMQWFVKDDTGRIARHQVVVSDKAAVPTTYPMGVSLGGWWEVGIKDRDREMYGIMHHACGLPWESRSMVGPFTISKTRTGQVAVSPVRLVASGR